MTLQVAYPSDPRSVETLPGATSMSMIPAKLEEGVLATEAARIARAFVMVRPG